MMLGLPVRGDEVEPEDGRLADMTLDLIEWRVRVERQVGISVADLREIGREGPSRLASFHHDRSALGVLTTGPVALDATAPSREQIADPISVTRRRAYVEISVDRGDVDPERARCAAASARHSDHPRDRALFLVWLHWLFAQARQHFKTCLALLLPVVSWHICHGVLIHLIHLIH
jgi:hypothetical protein